MYHVVNENCKFVEATPTIIHFHMCVYLIPYIIIMNILFVNRLLDLCLASILT